MIREILKDDIGACAHLLMEAYNCEPWNNQWKEDTAKRYLNEFFENNNFVGYVALEDEKIVGAVFAHQRTCWINDEVFIDEIFISPASQGKGYGTKLLGMIEEYSRCRKLGGVTLLTIKYFPAMDFYTERGYTHAEHVAFLYKET
ncbi:MAG TPA: GNAT family N-acetyltransferase [Clostridia bacterium]|nr:GNAT family N-acetyltransferase [Clostridia bacterium]